MKNFYCKKNGFLTVSFILLLSITGLAQQNIIDVPTSDIMEKDHLFFQEQFTISNRTIKSGTTFTWGLGNDFELGFNIEHLTFNTRPKSRIIILDPEQPQENPDLLLNAQKGLKLKEWSKLGAGTRSGVNIPGEGYDLRFTTFSYLNSQFSIPETENKLIIGGYYSNTPYSGQGNHWGLMLGAEAEIVKEKISLISDFISGNNSLSVINAGFQISLPKKWQIAFAAQFPCPGSNNHHGATFQISKK
jgi:hypothetical protein